MRPALILPTVLVACAFAGAAAAQQAPSGQTAGLRYLSWPGKTQPVRTVAAAPTPASAPAPTPVANAVPLARIAPAPTPAPSRNGLTPASAWTAPRAEAAFASPAPAAYTPSPTSAPAPAPLPAPQPAPRAEAAPEPAPPPPAVVDPMAPRADAPIFRLQRPAAASDAGPASADSAYGSSARYYSLHRQAGHAPDAIATPQAVYLDAMPVELAQTPQSADLAEPPAAPSLMRNADGRLMAAPQVEGDSLP